MRKRAVHITSFQTITSRILWRAVRAAFVEGNDYEEAIQFAIFREPDAKGFIVGRVIWLGGFYRGFEGSGLR